jgi:hypothetical protein
MAAPLSFGPYLFLLQKAYFVGQNVLEQKYSSCTCDFVKINDRATNNIKL